MDKVLKIAQCEIDHYKHNDIRNLIGRKVVGVELRDNIRAVLIKLDDGSIVGLTDKTGNGLAYTEIKNAMIKNSSEL